MKYLITCFLLVWTCLAVFGQAKSYEELGDVLTESLMENDSVTFKTILTPQETFIEIMEENAPSEVSKEQKEAMILDMKENYESQIMGAYVMNFILANKKVEIHDLDLKGLEYELLSLSETRKEDPTRVIHINLKHDTLKHLYVFVLEYKGVWYLTAPMIYITEEEMKF